LRALAYRPAKWLDGYSPRDHSEEKGRDADGLARSRQDAEERQLWRQLPFSQRYDWYRVAWVLYFVALILIIAFWQ
jgi:hypothetical protein